MIDKLKRWRERRALSANGIIASEGHLGGFIAASDKLTRSGLCIRHGDPETWYPDLWRWAVLELEVCSVLDIGCGEGHSAGFFSQSGCRVIGVDGSLKAREGSVIPEWHVVHDFVTGPYLPSNHFDLVWSCEFVEHVEESHTQHFLETFNYASRYIMMTYAVPGQPGWHHVNCQPQSYWVERLEAWGFVLDDQLTEYSRSLAAGGHYGDRGLFFRRRTPLQRAKR